MRRILFSSVVVGQVTVVAGLALAGPGGDGVTAEVTSVPSATRAWAPPSAPVHPLDTSRGLPSVRFAVAGDVGTGESAEWETAELMAGAESSAEFDELILLGDNAYPDGDPGLLQATVFDPFADVLDGPTGLIGVLGNHDVTDGNAAGQVDSLGMPARWYAVEKGGVLLVVLDSTQPGDETQIAFAEAALSLSQATWKIVALHHPLYSAGDHGSDLATRAAFEGLFVSHDVALVLSGHDHDYQRSVPIDGVTYIVSGGAARLRPTGRQSFTAFSVSEFHFVTLDVWEDALVVSAHARGGLLDTITLLPGTPAP